MKISTKGRYALRFMLDLAAHGEGRYVPLEATIKSFETILAGEVDDLPENAFFNVGDIDEVRKKARELQP